MYNLCGETAWFLTARADNLFQRSHPMDKVFTGPIGAMPNQQKLTDRRKLRSQQQPQSLHGL
jgi:hypothetical protein